MAWKNNISLEIDDAQKVSMRTFVSGAPWARRFFHPAGRKDDQGGRPGIRDQEQLTIQNAINEYCETLLQWLNQLSSNLGIGFSQQLLTANTLISSGRFENDLSKIVLGKARPRRSQSSDTVESIKVRIDNLAGEDIPYRGMAGLADCLWTHVV